MKKHNDEITLKDIFDIFLPKIWLIALVAVIFAAMLGGYTLFVKEDTYTFVRGVYNEGASLVGTQFSSNITLNEDFI